MKKILKILTAALFVLVSSAGLFSCKEEVENIPAYPGPLVKRRSDPSVVKHADGKYYLVHTYDYGSWSEIKIRSAVSIYRLRSSSDEKTIISSSTATDGAVPYGYFFGPELKFIEGQWFLFFTASESSSSSWTQRPFVAVCDDSDPVNGTWKILGKIQGVKESEFHDYNNAIETYSLGPTVFEYDGQWYFMYAGRVEDGNVKFDEDQIADGSLTVNGKVYEDLSKSTMTSYGTANSNAETSVNWQCIFIGKTSPSDFTKVTELTIVSVPEYDWECGIYSKHCDNKFNNTDDAPQALIHGNDLFVVFSASDIDESYCMGIMKCTDKSNLLSMSSWNKSSAPVFESDSSYQTYGPGSCSFTKDEDDCYDVMFYTARCQYGLNLDSNGTTGTDAYADKNRGVYAKAFTWKSNGYPDFGRAGGRD